MIRSAKSETARLVLIRIDDDGGNRSCLMKESADLKALMEFLFPRKRRRRGGRGGKVANIMLLPGNRVFPAEILFSIEQRNWFSLTDIK